MEAAPTSLQALRLLHGAASRCAPPCPAEAPAPRTSAGVGPHNVVALRLATDVVDRPGGPVERVAAGGGGGDVGKRVEPVGGALARLNHKVAHTPRVHLGGRLRVVARACGTAGGRRGQGDGTMWAHVCRGGQAPTDAGSRPAAPGHPCWARRQRRLALHCPACCRLLPASRSSRGSAHLHRQRSTWRRQTAGRRRRRSSCGCRWSGAPRQPAGHPTQSRAGRAGRTWGRGTGTALQR